MGAPRDADGLPLYAEGPRLGTEVVYGTHNFADPTTWATSSVRVVREFAKDSGDGLLWVLENKNVIDMLHGKVFDETAYMLDQKTEHPDDPHGYLVVVRVDGEILEEREPFMHGGDFEVDYARGQIDFYKPQSGKEVSVDYSYATDSRFRIAPDHGFNLDVERAKVLFSEDFVMLDSICFEIWGFAAVFAPQFGLPDGTKVLLQATHYRSMAQLVVEASDSFRAAPAMGGSERGLTSPLHALLFRYSTVRRLASAVGLELVVRAEHDIPMGGSHASATFYCVVQKAE